MFKLTNKVSSKVGAVAVFGILALIIMVIGLAVAVYFGLAMLSIWIHNILASGPAWPYDMSHILAWMAIYFIIGLVLGQIKKK